MACPRCQLEPTGCLCVLNSSDCLAVAGDGSEASPLSLSPVIDPGEELLTCGVDGLTAELPESVRVTPSCQIRSRTSFQNIPPGGLNIIQFNDVAFDTDSMASLGNNRIVVNTPGIYIASFTLAGPSAILPEGFGAYLWVNGADLIAISNRGSGSGPNSAFNAVTIWSFNTNDFIQLAATNPGSLNAYVVGIAWAPSLTMTFKRGLI